MISRNSDDAIDLGNRLRTFVRELDVPCGAERSAKLSAGVVDDARFLLSFPAVSTLRQDLGGFLTAFAFPRALQTEFEAAAAVADFFHLGYTSGRDGPVIKAYCEAPPAGRDRQRIHVAFKWSVNDPNLFVIDDYWLRPDFSVAAMSEFITASLPDSYGSGRATCLWLLERGSQVLPTEALFFLEVERRGGGRRSFDLRLYGSGLVVADALSLNDLRGADALLAMSGGHTLGHVSGGCDGAGSPFVTLYFDAEDFV